MQQQFTTLPVGRLLNQVHSRLQQWEQRVGSARMTTSDRRGQNAARPSNAQLGRCPGEIPFFAFPPCQEPFYTASTVPNRRGTFASSTHIQTLEVGH